VQVVDYGAQVEAAAKQTLGQSWLHTRDTIELAGLTTVLDTTTNSDGSTREGTITTDGTVIPFLTVDGIGYVGVGGPGGVELPDGKRYIALAQTDLSKAQGHQSAADLLSMLTSLSDKVTSLPDKTVNDVSSKGYLLTLRTRDWAEQTGQVDQFEQSFKGAGGLDDSALEYFYDEAGVDDASSFMEKVWGPHVQMEVYIGDGLVRHGRVALRPRKGVFDSPELEAVVEQSFHITQAFDLVGVGQPVSPTAPDPAQVVRAANLQEYMGLVAGRAAADN